MPSFDKRNERITSATRILLKQISRVSINQITILSQKKRIIDKLHENKNDLCLINAELNNTMLKNC
jgi:hypothetical protein